MSDQINTPAAALDALCARTKVIGTERVALADAAGRVLAAPIIADRPSPGCDVSAMDGYAVRLADAVPGTLLVSGEILIGREPPPMPEGAALRIVTGAPVPAGANAVIKREDVTEHPDRIDIKRAPEPGQHIRRRGENVGEGATIVVAGTLVTAPVAAGAATFGATELTVRRRVRVGVVVTGDEVLGPGAQPSPWQLRDSHSTSLGVLLDRPWLDAEPPARAIDERDAIRADIAERLERCDALIVTGGVSMGTRDHVPAVLADLGVETLFHRLPQRPGRPVLGGVLGDMPVLALPGNPVSVMVTARRLALPTLAHRAGLALTPPPAVKLRNAGEKALDLWWFRIVRTVAPGVTEPVATMGSGDIPAAARSDGFVEVPPCASGEGPFPFFAW